MTYFTQDKYRPSEQTLNIIRQVAYTYRTVILNGKVESYCLN